MDSNIKVEPIDIDNTKYIDNLKTKQESELIIESEERWLPTKAEDEYQEIKEGSRQRQTPKPKRKRLGWNEGSEVALLDLWPERLEELRGQRKNGHIYAEMADDLSKLGYTYSARDVQVKLQNFTQRYRKEKAAIGVSGPSPSTWPHYARVHQIIGGFKANLLTELALESIDDLSIASSSSSSPSIQLPAPSLPLPLATPSSIPSTAASAFEPAKKKRVSQFQATVLQKFESLSADIVEHLKKSEENENKLIEIEKKKADSLEKIATDNEELKNALILFLNKN